MLDPLPCVNQLLNCLLCVQIILFLDENIHENSRPDLSMCFYHLKNGAQNVSSILQIVSSIISCPCCHPWSIACKMSVPTDPFAPCACQARQHNFLSVKTQPWTRECCFAHSETPGFHLNFALLNSLESMFSMWDQTQRSSFIAAFFFAAAWNVFSWLLSTEGTMCVRGWPRR